MKNTMTKAEQELLAKFKDLYMVPGAIDGLTWTDCCDYDDNGFPTVFNFINEETGTAVWGYFEADKNEPRWFVENEYGQELKSFKRMSSAINYAKKW